MSVFNDVPCAPGACATCEILQREGESYELWTERVRRMVAPHTDTHCRHGHPWTADTLDVHPNGSRSCRQCQREDVAKLEVAS